ncbi:MAG: TetR/AcrR family transcriptional regulator [Acidimicrobiia bacterium]
MSDDPRDHILAEALRLVGDHGIARTSMADVASAAGVSRATLYRYFPGGKDEVMESLVSWEQLRFLDRLRDAVDDADDLADLLERALMVAKRQLDGHSQLQRVLVTEPERLFPLFMRTNSRIKDLVSRYLHTRLTRMDLADGVDPAWAADELARMFLGHIGAAGPWDLDDPAQVRNLVVGCFLKGIVPAAP